MVGENNWLAFTQDGKLLLSRCGRRIVLRAPDSGKELTSIDFPPGLDFGAFSPNGEWIAWTTEANTVVLTDLAIQTRIAELKGHKGHMWQVVFSADGKRLATGSADGTILIWDLSRLPKPTEEKAKP
jgi:WD40 repeat protein